MDHSKIDIVAGSDDWMVATSTVEASNIAYIGVSICSLRNYESQKQDIGFGFRVLKCITISQLLITTT